MDASLAAALSHPVPVAARPPVRTPGPDRIRAIYDEATRSLGRSGAARSPCSRRMAPFRAIVRVRRSGLPSRHA
eukprot:3241973-Alexandrium_andersonii.AAC.1